MKSFKHLSFTAGYTNIKCSCAFLRYNCAVVTLKRDVSLDASLRTSIFFSARDTYTFLSIIKKDLRKSWDIGHGHEEQSQKASQHSLMRIVSDVRSPGQPMPYNMYFLGKRWDTISTIGIMSSCVCVVQKYYSPMHSWVMQRSFILCCDWLMQFQCISVHFTF